MQTTATTRSTAVPSRLQVLLALATVYVVWGSTYLAIRVAVRTIPPFTLGALRFLIAGALVYLWTQRQSDAAEDRPDRRQWTAATIVGGLLLLGGNGAVMWAEQFVPSALAALLVATVPLWMALLAWLLHGERLSRLAIAGLALGFTGVAILVRPAGGGALLPSLVVVAGALSWAFGSLQARRLALPPRPLLATGMQMLTAGALFAVVAVVTGELRGLSLAAFTGLPLLALGYLVVFGSIVGFSAYVFLLRFGDPAVTSTYAYVNPVVAVLLGWGLLGEAVTPRVVLAGGVIVAAVALIVMRPTAANR